MDVRSVTKALVCFSVMSLLCGQEPLSPADTGSLPSIGMKDAVDAALAAGDEIKIVESSLDVARAQSDAAKSKVGFALSASGSYSAADAFGADLSGPAASALTKLVGVQGLSQSLQGSLSLSTGSSTKLSLSVSQSIPPPPGATSASIGTNISQTMWDGYPGGQAMAAVEKADLALQGKELAAAQSKSTIAAAVKRSYVTVLTAQRTLALCEGFFERQTALLKQVEAAYALGQSSEIDLMSARIGARTAELDLETARHDLETARRRLAVLMGRNPTELFTVLEMDEPDLPAASVDEAVALGLARRPDASQLELSRRAAAVDLALAKAMRQPNVSASAAVTMGIAGGSNPGDALQASLSARISMPVLDAGSGAAQVSSATASLAMLDAQASQLAKSIENDIRDAYWMASILRDRIAVAEDSMIVAERRLEIVRTQLQYGTATNQDLIDAQNAALNAGAAYLKAKGDYLVQEIALETSMGL